MKYIANIEWEWGLKEVKSFNSRFDRESFLKKNEEAINSVIISTKIRNYSSVNTKKISYLDMNMTDYEIDVLL